ncbi:ketoacyl-ACP synthase III family protein [Pseudonocardia sp. TRM90224]|uniref:ketoacyl-ACP synthase III family protein n=1 Tax=Pseudonocardia sp. TRM90224 TaxID=2812678 RepID=UPI001E635A35|nr:ketoacyl-ACP synthase III family protein [Pseudonocardia sp. TRM90224]
MMRFDDIWIAGTGGVLGELVPVEQAIASGQYAAAAAASTGMVSVSQADQAPPELAVTAGREAIKEAVEHGVEVGPGTLFLHSHGGFQGLDTWPVASWIAKELIGTDLEGQPTVISAASNGALTSLEIAANTLLAGARDTALITLGDRFAEPVNRWYLSPGMVFGDGGAAAVVTRGGGILQVRSIVTETDAALEGLSRGNEPFTTAPVGQPDSRRRTREFLAAGGISLSDVRRRSGERTCSVVTRALAEAGVRLDDVDWFLTPFVGRALFQDAFLRPLGYTPRNTLLETGLTIGHLGPADQIYALNHLAGNDLLEPGSTLLVLGTAMGFSFSAAVLTVPQKKEN